MVPHLLQASSRLIGQGVGARPSGGEQGEAGADLPSSPTAVVGQQEGAALVEV